MKETSILQSGAYKNWEVAIFVVFFLVIGFFLGVSLRPVVLTENMKDCLSRGGKYYINVENNSRWNYEKCSIEKEINY